MIKRQPVPCVQLQGYSVIIYEDMGKGHTTLSWSEMFYYTS